MFWIKCSASEDLGHKSKSNVGQVGVCKLVIGLLQTPATVDKIGVPKRSKAASSIAIMTPYTTLLARAIPSIKVYSIDGFQGHEADIIILVTILCNSMVTWGF